MSTEQAKPPLDEQITRLMEAGNQRAITLLYEHYAPALYNIILRIVRAEEVAEEVLQDAFLKIWDKRDQYDRAKGRLFTWMVRLSRNLAIDRIRSSQYKKGNRTEGMPESVHNSNSLSEETKISDPGLRKVVDQMDEKARVLIELLYFNDYTQKEASETLDIPLGTVKSRSRKAIQDLRSLLGDEGLLATLLFTLLETAKQYFGS
ncbi:MAG: sigma-70 family RNA polymerase sigma factor [Bacteroidetes bacterium]|jgi:RNA polymerase sigma-70 factor (ECF subfamily)|nr:sigma-70 family RNA polymerase sigma factor [Bacteroidota bacterium]